jgi:hypothetical protein
MKTLKQVLLFTIAILAFFLPDTISQAQAAGPATNVVTLFWTAAPPTSPAVPFFYEVHQSTNLALNVWTVIANVPSNTLQFSLSVDKDMKSFKVRTVNSTNSIWVGDFSNVASTAWPGTGGNLAIRLGP